MESAHRRYCELQHAKDLGFGLLTPGAITSDCASSGNIWVGCDSQTTPVLKYIGLATPVTTPLLPGKP